MDQNIGNNNQINKINNKKKINVKICYFLISKKEQAKVDIFWRKN